jgi:hypothetical protein
MARYLASNALACLLVALSLRCVEASATTFRVTNVTSSGFDITPDPLPPTATQMRCALLFFNPIDPNVLNAALALGGLSSAELWERPNNGTDFVVAAWDVSASSRNSATGLVPHGLYLTRCGVRSRDGATDLEWTDKPVTFLHEAAASLQQQQCHDVIAIQQSSWLWETWTLDQFPSLNGSKKFDFELQDAYSTHAVLGIHTSDYDNCRQVTLYFLMA